MLNQGEEPRPKHNAHDDHRRHMEAGAPQRVAQHRAHPVEHYPQPTFGQPARHAAAHEMHSAEEFRRRFWICLILTIPILAYTDLVRDLLAVGPPPFPGSQYVPFVLGSAVFLYGGSIFLQGAKAELATLTPGMMTLVSLAIVSAYVYSFATEFILCGEPLYWELSTLIVIMLLGHWIEMRAIGTARGAVAELAKLLPDTAERILDHTIEQVRLEDLRVGDLILVRPGSRVPADGEVIAGNSSVNEAMITGESRPVNKEPGSEVIAGTINGEGSLRIRVTKIGQDTMLAGIMRLVEQAQESRSRAQALADRAAYWLVLIAIGASIVTFAGWIALGAPAGFALERTVTVLVIACPHAFGLAIPLVISISTTLAARSGLLVRDRLALEKARELDEVVFDKTGTLTKGEFGVVGIATVDRMTEDEALALAAAAEGDSEHVLARAIRAEATHRGLRLPIVSKFEAMPGRGVRAALNGRVVQVGGPRLLEILSEDTPVRLLEAGQRWAEEGKTVVYLVLENQPKAAIALADIIRQESYQAVKRLQKMGIRVAMLTGDSEEVAQWVARELGINEYFAEVLPEHKVDKVNELRNRGLRVAMVGDGVNDAPALLAADVGIAIGAGTQVAIESAGIILVKNDPRDVVRIIELSRASYRKMIENLFWATGYNVVALPVAAGILAPLGILLIPAVGAILMSVSTIIVAINAQLLRRLNLQAI